MKVYVERCLTALVKTLAQLLDFFAASSFVYNQLCITFHNHTQTMLIIMKQGMVPLCTTYFGNFNGVNRTILRIDKSAC